LSESLVWVLDTSALIETKSAVAVSDQWAVFKSLEQLVIDGAIAMPRHVLREAGEMIHPDLPGAWASGMRDHLVHPLEPAWVHVTHVMNMAGDVVDPNKTEEDADPYVLALACQLVEGGSSVIVVTEDTVDRNRIAMTTACSHLVSITPIFGRS
jgi:rRNA maturation endonuclease Nob1